MSRREFVTLPQLLEARPWLTERYVRRLVAEKRIPHHKLPGSSRLLFDLADVDALAEAGRVEPVRLRLRRVG